MKKKYINSYNIYDSINMFKMGFLKNYAQSMITFMKKIDILMRLKSIICTNISMKAENLYKSLNTVFFFFFLEKISSKCDHKNRYFDVIGWLIHIGIQFIFHVNRCIIFSTENLIGQQCLKRWA